MKTALRTFSNCSFAFCLFFSIFISSNSLAPAQDRGLTVVASSVAGAEIKIGRQYAVLIAIDKYQEWNPLRNPVADAKKIKDILQSRYFIDEFIELYNDDATSAGIRRLFSDLIDKVGPTDSVLIFYAGHGYLDKFKTGFWIPVDGGRDADSQKYWIPNAQIRNFVTQMKARAVALISDSCFSGDLLNVNRGASPTIDSAYYRNALRYTARQVLSSGASESVPDESEFTRQFMEILANNAETCLDPLALYDRIRRGVTETLPLMGTLPGHETGGSFVLFLREGATSQTIPTGWLEFESLPRDAAVTIDGKPYGLDSKAERSETPRLLPGSYAVKVVAPYIRPYSAVVAVAAGKGTPISDAYVRFGVLDLVSPKAALAIEVSLVGGEAAQPQKPLHYELAEGNYELKAKPSDDIDWSWKRVVAVKNGATVSVRIPDEASNYSLAGRMQKEEITLASLKTAHESSVVNQRTFKTIAGAGFITGGVAGVATGILYFLGSSTMTAYKNAATAAAAEALHAELELYNTLFIASASLTGAGLGLGGVLFLAAPQPSEIAERVQASIDRLRELQEEAAAPGAAAPGATALGATALGAGK